jgi:outer membrane protein
MKKVLSILVLVAFITISVTATSTAQTKIGYINSEYLMSLMPEMKTAESTLQSYMSTFKTQLEKMEKEYAAKEADAQKNQKIWSKDLLEAKVADLQSLGENMQKYAQEAEEKVAKKRNELLEPIMEKAEQWIKDMAKEKGYDYVWDASQPGLLVAPPADDLLPFLKAKYGLKEPTAAAPTTAPKATPNPPVKKG